MFYHQSQVFRSNLISSFTVFSRPFHLKSVHKHNQARDLSIFICTTFSSASKFIQPYSVLPIFLKSAFTQSYHLMVSVISLMEVTALTKICKNILIKRYFSENDKPVFIFIDDFFISVRSSYSVKLIVKLICFFL